MVKFVFNYGFLGFDFSLEIFSAFSILNSNLSQFSFELLLE